MPSVTREHRHPATYPYVKDINKTMADREGKTVGKITNVSTRICASCGFAPCYIVRWPDGSMTKPCVRGCSYTPDGNLKID